LCCWGAGASTWAWTWGIIKKSKLQRGSQLQPLQNIQEEADRPPHLRPGKGQRVPPLLPLLLGSGGFDLGVDLGEEEQAAAGTLPVAGRALRILQGKAEALLRGWRIPAGKQTWLVQAARDDVLELVECCHAQGCFLDELACSMAA
ncbi:MAG: hypothetical protein AAFS07_19275, partial [Pseudomonadota bacterium]